MGRSTAESGEAINQKLHASYGAVDPGRVTINEGAVNESTCVDLCGSKVVEKIEWCFLLEIILVFILLSVKIL